MSDLDRMKMLCYEYLISKEVSLSDALDVAFHNLKLNPFDDSSLLDYFELVVTYQAFRTFQGDLLDLLKCT